MSKFAQWDNEESGLQYQGQLRKQEILAVADRLISPMRPSDDKVYQTASLDLTVGAIFTRKNNRANVVGPTDDSNIFLPDSAQPSVQLEPGEVAIVVTKEQISLPRNIVASSLPVMSRTREGILVLSHGHIDPGYQGYLIVRLLNMGSSHYTLRLGARILTLTLEQISDKADPYRGPIKDLQTIVNESRTFVVQTFPAAVFLDIEGKGVQHLLEPTVEALVTRLRKQYRKHLIVATCISAALAASIVLVVPMILPAILAFLAAHR